MTADVGLAIARDDVLAAAERIAGAVHRTPVVTSRLLDEIAGRELVFKCENLQRAGAFKIRGATNRLRSLDEAARARGVVAFSSGNHAQAVALAARSEGIDAVIVMPTDAPEAKVEATRAYGARIERYDRHAEDREAVARELAEREGRTLVPPFDDPLVMAGQGTSGLELVEQDPDLDAIVAPVGGGGLLSGIATAVDGSGIEVWGAEPARADDFVRSLEAGRRIEIEPPDTIADGARTEAPGALTLPVVQRRAAGIVRVPEAAIVRAMRLVLTRLKLVVEPTGALAAAAALEGLLPGEPRRVGVVLSGGNVDPATLAGLLTGASPNR